MRIAIISIMCALSGCSVAVMPDTGDTGSTVVDGGPDNDTSDIPMGDGGMRDSDTPNVGDAGGATCAGLPIGPVMLNVVSNTCEGPFSQARHFSTVVQRRTDGECSLLVPNLFTTCNDMPRDILIPLNLIRVGLRYTSEPVEVGCEGVTYQCYGVFDAATNEHAIYCTVGGSECIIDLE